MHRRGEQTHSTSLTPHHWRRSVVTAVPSEEAFRMFQRPDHGLQGTWASRASCQKSSWFDSWSREGKPRAAECEAVTLSIPRHPGLTAPWSTAGFTSVHSGAPASHALALGHLLPFPVSCSLWTWGRSSSKLWFEVLIPWSTK